MKFAHTYIYIYIYIYIYMKNLFVVQNLMAYEKTIFIWIMKIKKKKWKALRAGFDPSSEV